MNHSIARALVVGTLVALGLTSCAAWRSNPEARPTVGGTVTGEPRGPVQTASDARITASVKSALGADELVKARNINVDTFRGVVQLNGNVNSAAEKERAISLAKKVDGVVEVRDNLKLAAG